MGLLDQLSDQQREAVQTMIWRLLHVLVQEKLVSSLEESSIY